MRSAALLLILVGCAGPQPGSGGAADEGARDASSEVVVTTRDAPSDEAVDARVDAAPDAPEASPDVPTTDANGADEPAARDALAEVVADATDVMDATDVIAVTDVLAASDVVATRDVLAVLDVASEPDAVATPDVVAAPDVVDVPVVPDARDGATATGVLVHTSRTTVDLLGDYRAFRGRTSNLAAEVFRFTLAARSRVRLDLMGNVQSPLTDFQIATGNAAPAGFVWEAPNLVVWSVQSEPGVMATPSSCWAPYFINSCSSRAVERFQYLRRAPASDGAWDSDDVLPAGTYDLRIYGGNPVHDYDLYYYGEIEITPVP